MVEFKSKNSYWAFSWATSTKYRFIHPPEVEEFLNSVLATSESRKLVIKTGSVFWRAQLGNAWRPLYEGGEHLTDLPDPFPPERMKPIPGKVIEGRANPKGIPYLYVSTNRDTALAEVRPWIGSLISLAQFKTLRDLTVIDCTTEEKPRSVIFPKASPSPKEREKIMWSDIDRAFSRPVTPSDEIADYVPTQIIAELFRANRLDGVAYRSALGESHNLAIFDIDTADVINCSLFEAKKIDFTFKEAANPYFVKKYDDP